MGQVLRRQQLQCRNGWPLTYYVYFPWFKETMARRLWGLIKCLCSPVTRALEIHDDMIRFFITSHPYFHAYSCAVKYCNDDIISWRLKCLQKCILAMCHHSVMNQLQLICLIFLALFCYYYTLLAKKVVTPPLKTIKPMWIELLCFHLAEIGMIWTRDCSPTKSDTTLGRHSMQGQVGSSSSETTV